MRSTSKIVIGATTAAVVALSATESSAFVTTNTVAVRSTTTTAIHNDLWGAPPEKDGESNKDKSKALPFAARPKLLDGSLAADVGFDPFGLAGADKASLLYMREAEVKHSRLAMLAVVGWPIAELFDKPIADKFGLPTALTKAGSSPSILNGGLEKIEIAYWAAVILLAGIVEIESAKTQESKGKAYTPGDCNFDPLGLFPKEKSKQLEMQTKEIKHGRLSMMALLGFVVQEAIYRQPVVAETPLFFKPLF